MNEKAIFVLMEITPGLVKKLASLSKLEFTEEETLAYTKDLQQIIGFVEQLNEVDTEGVEPLTYIGDAVNVFREDVAVPSVSLEEALSNAPAHDGQFFKVPKVIAK